MGYIGNRYQIAVGTVTGTVQNFAFALPVPGVPSATSVSLYPSFLASLNGSTGTTNTNTVTLTLPDGTVMALYSSSVMAALTVAEVPANTVLEIAPKTVSGSMIGVVLNR